MKRSAIALMSVCASLLMVQTAAAQSVARQAAPRTVQGGRNLRLRYFPEALSRS